MVVSGGQTSYEVAVAVKTVANSSSPALTTTASTSSRGVQRRVDFSPTVMGFGSARTLVSTGPSGDRVLTVTVTSSTGTSS